MFRLILIFILFLFSLLNFFPVPFEQSWYAAIAITEFPWVFMLAALGLMVWSFYARRYKILSLISSIITFLILSSPVFRAYGVGNDLDAELEKAYGVSEKMLPDFHQRSPFSFTQMFTGNGAKKINYTNHTYAEHEGVKLDLNFSPSQIPGIRPCLIVVHGGSWKRGNFSEIDKMNNYFANAGYNVATINYRLAPRFHSPAMQEDLHAAFTWLRLHANELKIDTSNFLLMGRSAGAQIVLSMAYSGNENGVKGVAAFYGPNDMFWSYDHPDNKLIMDSRLVQRDFLGGAPEQVPDRYTAESPLLHVTPQTVPTLLVHGIIDAHVYYEQSVRLSKKLDENKVSNFLLTLPWATHGCEYNLNGPSGQLSVYSMERFFYAVTNK